MLTEVKYPWMVLMKDPIVKFHKNPSRKCQFSLSDGIDDILIGQMLTTHYFTHYVVNPMVTKLWDKITD